MQRLNAALANYDSWERPWEFVQYVERLADLSASEREVFAAVWSEAIAERHWTLVDPLWGCKLAHNALRARFSDLSHEAIAAVVRAASYQSK